MAGSLHAQKNAVWHWMTKHDFQMIVSYLEDPDCFAATTGGGWKTKIAEKTWTKVTTFVTWRYRFALRVSLRITESSWGRNLSGLTADMVFDASDLCPDSQHAFSVPEDNLSLSEEEEETIDRDKESIDLLDDDDVIKNQTASVIDGDEFHQITMTDDDDGLGMGNQTTQSTLVVEANRAEILAENQCSQQ
ncbi:hypothetical protein R1sor_016976 [Riccia sorocarpa]|uniref:Uncharacterized protein n=1 Tax=Riccia sorocarpa TaxID=122646 RepID=A0ABD3I8V5_9MARC